MNPLKERLEALYDLSRAELLETDGAMDAFQELIAALEAGLLRAAVKREDGTWVAEPAVKKGILLGFRLGENGPMGESWLPFSDKHTYPPQRPPVEARNIRVVPGGSSIRVGAYIGHSVTCMPPMYINVGAWVGDGTMVDSHALVGSCAQIGERVHLSAAAQIGGVLEPIGQAPVVIEDGVLVGGNSGIYEGTVVREGAVIGTGTILNGSTPVYDLVRQEIYRASADAPLEIPAGAVVVPGSRPARGGFAQEHGIHLQTAVIVKYRDAGTDARAALEEALR
ncbi:MAG: 2,3,4,5-tetrahydropyridine-2,6-dicarboxylate N-succinyltransferase [Myxococcales bacterium]|nr:2,3,4,5-tetrahydropyridine-2,6-dicarboxylate N-succinyltransferase [Myxococcales bacterium]